MTLSRAEQLRQRAREIEDHAYTIRWVNPHEARALNAIARDLADIANHLPPEPRRTP